MDDFTIIGLIFMLVLGPAVGNYACSVVYRLPLGRTPFERHPYCGSCNADLKTKDLFPILSWLSTRGKCRYCNARIPGIYTVIELACLFIFVTCFLMFGLQEPFFVYAAYAVFAVILAAIEWQQGWLSSSIYSYAMFFAVLGRSLAEGTIYGWIQAFVITLVVGLLLARAESAIRKKPFKPFEADWLWWACLFAAAFPLPPLAPLLLIFARGRVTPVIAGLLAVLLPLYPMW